MLGACRLAGESPPAPPRASPPPCGEGPRPPPHHRRGDETGCRARRRARAGQAQAAAAAQAETRPRRRPAPRSRDGAGARVHRHQLSRRQRGLHDPADFFSGIANACPEREKKGKSEDRNHRQYGNQNTDGGPGKITQHAWHQHHLSLAPGPVERQSQAKLKETPNVPLHLGYVACRTFAHDTQRAAALAQYTNGTRR